MLDIVAGLAAIKGGFDVAKNVGELVRKPKLDANEIARQLLSLQSLMLQSQEALLNASQEVQSLNLQVESLRKQADVRADMEYRNDGGFYVRKSEGGHIPYCPLCFSANGQTVPLNPRGGDGYYECAIHKSSHQTAAFRYQMNNRADTDYDPFEKA